MRRLVMYSARFGFVCVAVFSLFFSFCFIARCEVVWCAGWWCRFRLRCSPPRSLFELCTRGVFLTYASTHASATEFREIDDSQFCLVLLSKIAQIGVAWSKCLWLMFNFAWHFEFTRDPYCCYLRCFGWLQQWIRLACLSSQKCLFLVLVCCCSWCNS